MTFEKIVTKEEIAPEICHNVFKALQLKICSFFFSRVNIQDFSKCRLLQDCSMGERVNRATGTKRFN